MTSARCRVVVVGSVLLSALVVVGAGAQRAYPVPAVIRGENVWLRAEPAEVTAVLAYLQRGDAVTLTGPAEAADGDAFYPVEVFGTGESGWVRELFINPASIAPLTDPVVVVEIPAEKTGTRQDEGEQRDRARDRGVRAVVRGERSQREPRQVAEEPAPAPRDGCDPSYPTVCLPPPPPDLNCADVPGSNIRVLPPDPHNLDRNSDGVGCESG